MNDRRRDLPAPQLIAVSLALSILVLTVATPPMAAQSVSASVVISGFLLNFAKFTDWPPDASPSGAPIVLCVTDADVAAALTAMTTGRAVGSRSIVVTRVTLTPAPRQCAVLYASGLNNREMTTLVDALAGTSVLSVSDSAEFTRRGGIAHLFLEDGRMRFTVNVTAAERARLRLSAKLLNLATIVRH